MYDTFQRTICFVLVLVLLFFTFADPLAPEAEAVEPITATLGVVAFLVTVLGMIGISFATVDAANQGVQGFLTKNPDIVDEISTFVSTGAWPPPTPPFNSFKMNLAGTAAFITIVKKLKDFFSGEGESTVYVELDEDYYYDSYPDVGDSNMKNYESRDLFYMAPYSRGEQVTFSRNGVNYNYYVGSPGTYGYYALYCSLAGGKILSVGSTVGKSDIRFGFYTCVYNGHIYLCPYIASRTVNSEGFLVYDSNVAHPSTYLNFCFQKDFESLFAKVPVPYTSNSKYNINDITKELTNHIANNGPITIDYTDTLTAIENKLDEQIKTDQDQLLEQAGIRDILIEIRDNQPQPEEDFDVPKLAGDSLGEKFPFCVPFDLFRMIQALDAVPVAPKWSIPFRIERLSIDESLELDLTEFEPVSKVFRWGLTLIFILGLLIVTRKMIKG